jgi:hypothetical protein
LTKERLNVRRGEKNLRDDGYVEIAEQGDPLWRLHRSFEAGHLFIADAKVGPDRKRVFIKFVKE